MSDIKIRCLNIDNLISFREIRLEALNNHPNVFGSNKTREQNYTDAQWIDMWLTPNAKNVASFGLFDDENLVGITAIVRDKDDPTGQTAKLCASYIQESYRGMHLSRLLYQARIDWAREQGNITKIIVSHRASNETSKRANQAFAFKQTHRAPHQWPDGQTEDEVFYALHIKPKI